MSDAELQAKYPLPPEMQELAETMLNGGKPVARPAVLGIEQMQAILKKLRADKVKTLAAIEANHDLSATGEATRKILGTDLAQLNREIKYYEERLAEYELQHQHRN